MTEIVWVSEVLSPSVQKIHEISPECDGEFASSDDLQVHEYHHFLESQTSANANPNASRGGQSETVESPMEQLPVGTVTGQFRDQSGVHLPTETKNEIHIKCP